MADPQIPLKDWVEEIRSGISADENIDMALLIVKATDYRIDIAQITCMQAMKKFLDNLKPANTFICFTHCDESCPTKEFIDEKLASYKKYGKLEIPEENIILFDRTQESLQDFVASMVPGEIKIVDNIDEALVEFDEGLPSIAKNVDRDEHTRLTYQLEMLRDLWEDLLNAQIGSQQIFINCS